MRDKLAFRYVHTVEALINRAGLRERIEPLAGKVPTLVLDDGEALYGGPVIYEHLDSLHHRPPLFPPAGRQRYTVLRQAWLAVQAAWGRRTVLH